MTSTRHRYFSLLMAKDQFTSPMTSHYDSFLMQFGLWRAAAFVSSPIHLLSRHRWFCCCIQMGRYSDTILRISVSVHCSAMSPSSSLLHVAHGEIFCFKYKIYYIINTAACSTLVLDHNCSCKQSSTVATPQVFSTVVNGLRPSKSVVNDSRQLRWQYLWYNAKVEQVAASFFLQRRYSSFFFSFQERLNLNILKTPSQQIVR